ncbi:SPOR domain-containing protein [Amylibacter marinus]|uniref:SPOR domain-containing protein n=1 Tax=Amylibacter marinus TaxID=1475483 RepID=UPI0024E0F0D6|nr:SPOR domain-containing protein [Amylibacter marinus]
MLATVALGLAACETSGDNPFKSKPNAIDAAPDGTKSYKEVDVEAPEVFHKTDKSLWDGRPSLGGVWVAHNDVKQPERVIIRNQANGKFVIGALFRKSSGTPGPAFQMSSDAASALGTPAGTPVSLSVTAMRLEKREIAKKTDVKPADSTDIATTALEALETADDTKPTAKKPTTRKGATKKPTPPSKPAVKPSASAKAPAAPAAPKADANTRYVQLGLFSVKGNADGTLKALKAKGLSGKIVTSSAKGKTFYRVLAGPAAGKAEQARVLKEVKAMGFNDAYLVKG